MRKALPKGTPARIVQKLAQKIDGRTKTHPSSQPVQVVIDASPSGVTKEQERIVRRSKLRPASIGLPKNGDDGRVGEARRITFAVISVTDNVRGEPSAHVLTASELNRQKIARAIECDGHDAESVGIIDTTDVVRRDHSLYLPVAKDISSPQARTKSARSPILKCAARSIRLIRYRPAAPPAPVFEPMPIIGKHHVHPYSNAILGSTSTARLFQEYFAAKILVSWFVAKAWPAFRGLWRESGIQAGCSGPLQKRAPANEPEGNSA